MSDKTKWYQKTWGIIALLILFFPAGLFLMWKHASWNKAVKGVITAIFVFMTIGMMNSEPSTTPTANQESIGQPTTVEADTPAKEVKQETVYAIGDTIQGKSIEVTVTSTTERSSVGGQYFSEKASEGATLVVVEWQYKNFSDKPARSSTKPNIKLVDANGTEYGSDLGKTSSYATEVKLDRKVWSDLNPGITVKDAEVFEVSDEAYSPTSWYVQVKLEGKTHKVALQ